MDVRELSKIVSEQVEMPEYKVRQVLLTAFKTIRVHLLKAEIIRIKNLLSMCIEIKQPREYYDVNKQAVTVKPRHFYLKVVPSKLLKKEIGEKKTY